MFSVLLFVLYAYLLRILASYRRVPHKFLAVSLPYTLLADSLYSYCCICRISVVAQIPLSGREPAKDTQDTRLLSSVAAHGLPLLAPQLPPLVHK